MALDDEKLEPTEDESLLAAADAEIDELTQTNARPTLISEINEA
jgi:hypothetical protein